MELEGASLSYSEDGLGYYIFDLAVPMQPGEIRELKFDALMQKQGFRNGRRDIRLVRNGTFIHNDQLTPHVGFFPGLMIEDNKTRQKLGLAPLPRMPKLEDSTHYSTNGLRYDSDFIQFETTVSTVSSQIAVAPGYLQKEWQEGERRYFHYKMDAPMMNFYSFLSAEYRVKKDKWRDVDIQVLYHPAHEYNVDRMISGVKESLSYFSDNFSPYQYKQLRILEFPGYRQFAQAFPNTVPFSESIGFVADVSDPEVIDLPFYVTAHEVAHQWWGYQVMAAQVQGNSFIIETLSQYSALLVMEQKYGKHQVHKFLELERDKYLTGRTKDAEGELPLYRVEDQSYIHYRKGAIAMYALKDYLGEDTINKAIRRFIEKHANRSNRYAISTDFIDLLKEEITSKDEPIVADMLEKITLFDLKVLHSTATKLDSGQFKVSVQLEASKYYDDELAPEQIALGYPVEIGLFSANPLDKGFNKEDVISVEKYALDGKRASIEIMVDKRPEFVGVDPYLKLIDREIDDNIREVEFEAQPEQAFAKLNN